MKLLFSDFKYFLKNFAKVFMDVFNANLKGYTVSGPILANATLISLVVMNILDQNCTFLPYSNRKYELGNRAVSKN